VNMYLDIPSFELSLDEFEEYALSRLKVSIIKQRSCFPRRHCLFCCILPYSPYRSSCCRAIVDDGVNDLYWEPL
jgi:hypothetical protein